MRNEGPYLLEWLAYHRVIGFEQIVIVTNDCIDGSDALLDALSKRGLVTHINQTVAEGQAPQDNAMRLALAYLRTTNTTWLCHIDADEFLNIRSGQGRLPDLLADTGHADAIALPWLAFGDSGHSARTLPILPNFTACEVTPNPETVKFKSMFRIDAFEHANDHMPQQPTRDVITVAADGTNLGFQAAFTLKRSQYRPVKRAVKPDAAVLNHYTRASDDFLMKNHRGDGQGKRSEKYHIGSKWHRMANQNAHQDDSILRHWPAVQARLTEWRDDAEIAALETACCAADTALRAEVLTAESRRAWSVAT
nr:glycosyltransferase family 2 protein [Lentibacter algarum]